jgi:uncharacterized repeat protein (TIGR03803 family)
MSRIRFAKVACMVALLCLTSLCAQAQTFTPIANLPKNLDHMTQLIQGEDGNLLGTNSGGGAPYGVGVILRISLTGQGRLIYQFCLRTNCPDGEFPEGLYQVPGGTMYGLTDEGGTSGNGALFQLSSGGKETVLYSFCSQPNCADGVNPSSAPVPSLEGGLLGTAWGGGANGQGTLFEVFPTGEFTVLYAFCAQANCTDGALPATSPIQTPNGNIYGTTESGGTYASGNVYALTPEGQLFNVRSFLAHTPGFSALPKLILGADGNFYGVTEHGGAPTDDGTVFKINPHLAFTNLYNFCPKTNCAHGADPVGLIQGSDGNLYGITQGGGNESNTGTIFKITPQGVLTTLYAFCQQANCLDGGNPQSLMQETNGLFYGTTGDGGTLGGGTVFSLSMGLAPFVQTNPGFGKVGGQIGILGNNLTGTTSVTFHGVTAAFTVVSDSYITATVPAGATSGKIEVTTPTGMLASNFPFQVLP